MIIVEQRARPAPAQSQTMLKSGGQALLLFLFVIVLVAAEGRWRNAEVDLLLLLFVLRMLILRILRAVAAHPADVVGHDLLLGCRKHQIAFARPAVEVSVRRVVAACEAKNSSTPLLHRGGEPRQLLVQLAHL